MGCWLNCGKPDAVLPFLMTLMVGVDAFSQALTNPLVSRNVYGAATFSRFGLQSIEATSSIDDIVRRNVQFKNMKASFSNRLAVPGSYGLPVIGKALDVLDFFLLSGWDRSCRCRLLFSNLLNYLFQPTIVLLDYRAISALFASDGLVQDYGFSWAVPPLPLVGNVPPSIFMSGAAHDNPKRFYLELLNKRSEGLLPSIRKVFEEFKGHWEALGQFSFRDEIEKFSVAFLFEWIVFQRPDIAQVRQLYNGLFTHFGTSITRFIPWVILFTFACNLS